MRRGGLKAALAFSFFLFAGFLLPQEAAFAIENSDCLACHDTFEADEFASSAHASNLCTSCHSAVKELPHEDKLAPVDCSSCHRIESEIYKSSDHGKTVRAGAGAASCLDCHGNAHAILSSRDPKSPVYRLNIPKTCATCHENQKKMARYHLLEERPFKSYSETVHGKALTEKNLISSAVCTDCHGSHDLHAPANPEGKMYRMNVPATCGKCHENVLQTYRRSIHGKAALSGKREAPVCTDCHGEHTIKSHLDPTSSVYTTIVSEKTCGHCHAAEKIITKYRLPSDRLKTYLESYHGLAGRFGMTTVANCASCHGAHDILPSSDLNSSVNKRNLSETCGRCHPNVGEQLAKGSIHVAPSPEQDRAVYLVTLIYLILIPVVVGGMLLHNSLDFAAKLRKHYQKKKEEGKVIRFTAGERIQHLVLIVTFVTLAYTGFALKWHDAWWALPFAIFDLDLDLRGIVHRVAALLFCVSAVYHIFYLLFTGRGRGQLAAFAPKWKDVSDCFGLLKHNLGLAKVKPKFARYSYIEKAEYWALAWGSLIMIATGALLTFENFTMRHFPKWVFDVAQAIHFYEAVLATLAIIVWHFYAAIFDPDRYPMDWSMTTGKVSEGEQRE